MKVLTVGAGASWSTKDVENGVLEGLRAAGLQAGRYNFDSRLASASTYLEWVYRQNRKADPVVAKPTPMDVQLFALSDVLPRALAHEADWIVFVSAMFVPRAFLDVAQRAGLPVALLFTESPYDRQEFEWARCADLVWTNERSSVGGFRAVQPESHYLPHAWRPSVHTPDGPCADVPSHDVVFVGSYFEERAELLEAIDWTGIDLGLYGNWRGLRRRSPLRPFIRQGVVENTRAAALYRRAKIGLNLYRQTMGWTKGGPRIAHAESLNPRAYELAACRCFHLSDARAEVREIFGDLVPTFTTGAEAEALIRQWLADDASRQAAAHALPAAVQAHSWHDRGRQMAADLARALPAAVRRIADRAQQRQAALEAVA